jgi:hypothetical protein
MTSVVNLLAAGRAQARADSQRCRLPAAAMGTNLLDTASAAPALEAGLKQAMSRGEPAHTLWSAI